MLHYYKTHPRFATCVLVTFILVFLLPHSWIFSTRVLVAWDIGTGCYLVLAFMMMAHSNVDKIRQRASEQYEGKIATLSLTTVAAIASLVAIVQQLATAKAMGMEAASWHVSLAGITVFLSWTFMQTMFGLHYTHEYYLSKEGQPTGGLIFPGSEMPEYGDFVYFSFTIGATAQTSDISISSKVIRRIVTLHSVIAFFFNAIVLALTISIGAGLFE